MTASALPMREFTLEAFARFTPELDGAERMAVFFRLPDELREQAWRRSDQAIATQTEFLFRESCS